MRCITMISVLPVTHLAYLRKTKRNNSSQGIIRLLAAAYVRFYDKITNSKHSYIFITDVISYFSNNRRVLRDGFNKSLVGSFTITAKSDYFTCIFEITQLILVWIPE